LGQCPSAGVTPLHSIYQSSMIAIGQFRELRTSLLPVDSVRL
jgi:hypothetical protein